MTIIRELFTSKKINKYIIYKLDFIKNFKILYLKRSHQKVKRHPQNGREYLRIIYLIKDLYPKENICLLFNTSHFTSIKMAKNKIKQNKKVIIGIGKIVEELDTTNIDSKNVK